jgi:holo-[acyl-carrier protein] synthase
MNVIAHGVDLVHCPRIAQMWERHAERFLHRVYTPAEQAYCLESKEPVIRLSGRFAAKEAVMKMLGTGWRGGIEWTDIETLPDPQGKPLVTLHGATQRMAKTRGITHVLVSVSHAGEYACASVIGVGPLAG